MNQELKRPSIGRSIERIRKLRGFKQEELASYLGITRQGVSKIEQSENIEDDKLDQIASFLGVSKEGIKNFSEEATFNYVQNNYEGSSSNYNGLYECTFNPLEKYIAVVEKNEKLYEQLLKSEREKNEMLQRLLEKK
jgi:transcriptional regulator with XRE-family HTH domain